MEYCRLKSCVMTIALGALMAFADGKQAGSGIFLTTPCDAICCSQRASSGIEGMAPATVKVDILLPQERRLREFSERNIALNWELAAWERHQLHNHQEVVYDFVDYMRKTKNKFAQKEKAGDFAPPDIGWSFSLKSVVPWNSKKYFSYRSSVYTFLGGIHSDIWYQNGTYSYQLGRRMTVADLFEKRHLLAVVKLIRKQIHENESCGEGLRERMGKEPKGTYEQYASRQNVFPNETGDPCVTENFMIVEAGIVWTYNEYEIACYTEGHTDVLVPWEQLAPYLKSKSLVDECGIKGALEEMEEKARKEGRILKVGNLEFF